MAKEIEIRVGSERKEGVIIFDDNLGSCTRNARLAVSN